MSHSTGTVDYFVHSFIQLMYFTGIYLLSANCGEGGRKRLQGNKLGFELAR